MTEEGKSSYVVVDDFFINWKENTPLLHFPYHVQEILYELALNYLITQPKDALDFCLDFLVHLRESKNIDVFYDYEDFDEPPPIVTSGRRNSVFAKSFDPHELEAIIIEEQEEITYPKTDQERSRLSTSLRNVLFFKTLSNSDLNRVIDAMFLKRVTRGDMVIQQGDDGDYFYVVQSGIFNAFKTKDDVMTDLCHYANSGYFGELALLYNQPRAASIVALTDGLLWALDRDTFQKIVLTISFKRSLRYEAMINKVPMLMSLDPPERVKVADSLVSMEFSDGYSIINEGDRADGMYFIESGTVVILRKNKYKQDVFVKDLKEGDYFGELALITKKPRACSVVAKGHVKVAFLEVAAFERLLGPCMEIMKRSIQAYEEQLQNLGLLDFEEKN